MDTVSLSYLYNPILTAVCFVAAVICAVYIWETIWGKFKSNLLELVSGVIVCLFCILYIYPGLGHNRIMGSSLAMDFLQVLVITITIKTLGYLRLKMIDYIMFTIALFLIREYCYVTGLHAGFLLIGGWILLCLLIKRRSGSLKREAVGGILSFIAAQISYFIYGEIFDIGVRGFYYSVSSNFDFNKLHKLIFLGMLTVLFTLFMAVILILLKKIFQYSFTNINQLSVKYEELGRYLLAIPLLIGVITFVMEVLKETIAINTIAINNWIALFVVITFLGMQLFYLKLLFKTIHLREHLEYKETEQINLQLYNRDITKNLQEIREIKHDLKNVFLTMGEYVARSEDAELKDYYYENIASFAGNELRRNDLYLSLQELQNESIKAFLYYKFLQGFDACVDMQLETELDHSVIPYISDYSDIIRILGIFIDNAMEESLQVSQGYVRVVIKEKDGQMCFGVKNTVRDTIRQNGIHKGISSKGLGRGYGLSIVEKLVNKHDDIIWDSYFQENVFVQMISTTH